MQSVAAQYGVLPAAQGELPWAEWAVLVAGLTDETPLGRLVARMGREDDVRVQEELVKCNHETPREFPPRWRFLPTPLPRTTKRR